MNLIDRQDAIDTVLSVIPYDEYWAEQVEKAMRSLPSAQPERLKGKWMPHIEKTREYIGTVLVNVMYDYWFCDTCGYRVENGQPTYNFCPNCGVDMRGEQDG